MRRLTSTLAAALVAVSLATTAQPAAADDTAAPAVPAPTVTALSVTTGWDKRPTTTVVTGTNLNLASAVMVGDTAARILTSSSNTLLVQVPARGAGTFPVTLTAPDGTQVATSVQFKVLSFNAELLRQVNVARGTSRKCGSKTYKKVGPVKASSKLDKAAATHSTEMATRNYFSHTGKDKSSPRKRMEKAGQTGRRYTGENIAAGFNTPDSVMRGWLASPGHCANIMSSHYRYLGVGYAYGDESMYLTYWTQDFTS